MKKELELFRVCVYRQTTMGMLTMDGELLCFVIEDVPRTNKVPHKTRIPQGRYRLKRRKYGKHYESFKSRWGHRFSIELEDVPNFNNILIHPGNSHEDTWGCLLPCEGVTHLNGELWGMNSVSAYKKLYELISEPVEWHLTIYNEGMVQEIGNI